jgi:hypothetical protein
MMVEWMDGWMNAQTERKIGRWIAVFLGENFL